METEGRLRVADVFVGIRDPRQVRKVDHDLVELLVIAVCGVLAGADDFVEIEEWAKEQHNRGQTTVCHLTPGWPRQSRMKKSQFRRSTATAGKRKSGSDPKGTYSSVCAEQLGSNHTFVVRRSWMPRGPT